MGQKLNLKNVRIGWVNVFEKAADRTTKDGKLKKGTFQLTAYLDKDDSQLSKMEATVLQVLTDGLGSAKAAEKWLDRNYGFGCHEEKCMIRDLAERDTPIEGLEDGLYFRASSHKKPVIMTSAGERQLERGLTIDGDDVEGKEVYSGCYANISVEIYWYAEFKTLMVNLLGVRFREDGEAFGGAGETADENDLEDEDEKPSKSKRRNDDEDEKPRRKSRRDEDEEDDEEEERPRRRSRD
jgi:Protein of unknown function (DUF2815).